MKKFSILSILALGLLATTSCDDYLDINTDPNAPSASNVTPSMMMPAVEMNLASSYGNYLRIVGGYHSQHYAQSFGTSNYLDYSQFSQSATRSSGTYTQLNQRALANLKTIIEQAKASEENGTLLAATTLRAFIYEVLVDCYGEVPYTEALNIANVSPKYDNGETIYKGVLAELDEALEATAATDVVCTNFLFPGQSASEWIKFANALKLRMLMRMSSVCDVKAELDALVAEGNFPTADVTYAGCWANEVNKMSPYYAEEFYSGWGSNQVNVIANLAIIGTMQVMDAEGNITYSDPRLPAFFEKNASGKYTGGVSGSNFSTSATYKASYWCRPVASFDMPVYLISVAETEFFLSEYYAAKGNAADAAAHYAKAIEASFASAGVEGAEENIAQYPYDQSNYKKSIGVAKWIALAGINGFESWCEMRRLDYPTFGSKSGLDFYDLETDGQLEENAKAYEPGTLYTPINVFGQVGSNKIIERYPYAESSSSRNSNTPDFPGYTTPVFWGK